VPAGKTIIKEHNDNGLNAPAVWIEVSSTSFMTGTKLSTQAVVELRPRMIEDIKTRQRNRDTQRLAVIGIVFQ
jgi:hypothetical protein